MHVQRRKEEDLLPDEKVVVGVKVSKSHPSGESGEEWESRPAGIWVLRSSKRHDSDSQKVVTAVDLLFGADALDPRPGWELQRPRLDIDAGGLEARLSVRHGQPHAQKDIVPRVGSSGKFKILQISDAHLSTGVGKCRDAIGANGQPSTNCEADLRTMEFIQTVLDDEKPDLVVLSGDQLEGPTSFDPQTTIFKYAAPLIDRHIPYATIFGNHDDEKTPLGRAAQMSIIQTLPYSLSQPGPEDLAGVGNYYVEVLAPSPSQHSAITIYLLDSHGLTPDEKKYEGYDWIKQNQIDWFQSTAQGLRAKHKKYTHIHLDLAFIHIPLPEFAVPDQRVMGGQRKESVTAPGYNSHFYQALQEEGIVAVGAGHDHVNDYCGLYPQDFSDINPPPDPHKKGHLGPWMCYAGGSGFGGYAGYGGFHRRVRVWEVDTNAGKLMTWKRVECCTDEETKRRVDELVLVDGGVAVAPG